MTWLPSPIREEDDLAEVDVHTRRVAPNPRGAATGELDGRLRIVTPIPVARMG